MLASGFDGQVNVFTRVLVTAWLLAGPPSDANGAWPRVYCLYRLSCSIAVRMFSPQPNVPGNALLPLSGKYPSEFSWLKYARQICLRLFWQVRRAAASRTFWTAGSRRPMRIAMIAITTSNSMRVNPVLRVRGMVGLGE